MSLNPNVLCSTNFLLHYLQGNHSFQGPFFRSLPFSLPSSPVSPIPSPQNSAILVRSPILKVLAAWDRKSLRDHFIGDKAMNSLGHYAAWTHLVTMLLLNKTKNTDSSISAVCVAPTMFVSSNKWGWNRFILFPSLHPNLIQKHYQEEFPV